MPLPSASSRRLLHLRDIQLRGYVREDGQIEIDARMTDVKTYSAGNVDRSMIPAGEPVHDMWIRMTLTPDELEITACEAAMDFTPYGICPQAAPKMERLVGLKIGKGFLKAVSLRLGGVEGCTHLRELLQPVATTAYQTQYSLLNHAFDGSRQQDNPGLAPGLLNSCHAYEETSPVVARLLAQEKPPASN
ncbi:DUF2889 domain-containing protein [Acidocella sp.]|uniref:DUF2889 domain-containing protein n=1 Tax=Acidocella sp. TaxID=50710 RepID=UPI003D011C4A